MPKHIFIAHGGESSSTALSLATQTALVGHLGADVVAAMAPADVQAMSTPAMSPAEAAAHVEFAAISAAFGVGTSADSIPKA